MDSSATVNHNQLFQYMVSFNPIGYGYMVWGQSDLVNTTKSVLPVCNKPYHTNKEIL